MTIPSSVSGWGEGGNCFSNCTGELIVNCRIPDLGYNKGIFNSTAFEKVVIGDEVTGIGAYSFQNCSKLQGLIIGKNVNSIGSGAFYNNTNKLYEVVCKNPVPPKMGDDAYNRSVFGYWKFRLEVPAGSIAAYKNTVWNNAASISEMK